MIEHIDGLLAAKAPAVAVIEVGGIGFEVFISLQTFDRLPQPGEKVRLCTHLHVREDAMQLFGFIDEGERAMFRSLQGISGIGVRTALNILSGCGADRLRAYVASGDVGALTSIPGVGKKTAERIVVELRDVLGKDTSPLAFRVAGGADARSEALKGLMALGYGRQSAEKALGMAWRQLEEAERSPSNLIKTALRTILSK